MSDNNLSPSLGELLLMDVFSRHGLNAADRRTLSPEEREQIRKIVEDLKVQTEKFLQSAQTTTQYGSRSGDVVIQNVDGNAEPQRKRLSFLKRSEDTP